MIAAARPGIRHNAAGPPVAPLIRQSAYFSRTSDSGSTAFSFPSSVLLHSSLLVLIGEQGSGIASLTLLGTWTRATSATGSVSANIGWCSDVTSTGTQFLVTYNSGFHNIAGICYELTGLTGKTILNSFTESTATTISSGSSFSTSRTATAAGQLVVANFAHVTDQASAPTWTETPSGIWTRDKDVSSTHLQSGDLALTGAAGLHTVSRDYTGTSMSNLRAAALIG